MAEQLSPFTVSIVEVGHTVAKVLRSRLHADGPSWTMVKGWIEARRVTVNAAVCVDIARRLKEGDVVELLARPSQAPRAASPGQLVLRHLDGHVVVVEKPAGVSSVRHPAELEWPEQKKRLDPTLHDLTQLAIARDLNRNPKTLPPLRIVHRLDKDTSGLLTFARSVAAERELGQQFRKHTVVRRYLALVPGVMVAQTIQSTLIRDRGDGRRGSTRQPDRTGKVAITHLSIEERLPQFTLVSCKLETGRTHQIRIHLSEAKHPVCGETVYTKTVDGVVLPATPKAPRLCLHATELGYEHPVTGGTMLWTMPMPADMAGFVERMREQR